MSSEVDSEVRRKLLANQNSLDLWRCGFNRLFVYSRRVGVVKKFVSEYISEFSQNF